MCNKKASTIAWKPFCYGVFMSETNLKIDAHNGAITLPGGFVLHPKMKIQDFRVSDLFNAESVFHPNTPWYYHHFSDGFFDEAPISFVVCFYENQQSGESAFVSCDFSVNKRDDSTKAAVTEVWDAEMEAQIWGCNLPLLKEMLGQPHRFQRNMTHAQRCAVYDFAWGKIWCGSEDIKSNVMNPGASLRYFANDQWAHDDYKRYAKNLNRKSLWTRWKK